MTVKLELGSIRRIWLPINVPLDIKPILHRFWDRRRFQSKIVNFPTPCIYAPADGVPLELCIGARGQKLESWGYRAEKEVWRYL